MNCKKCGNLLAPTDTVCKNCGEPVMPNENPVANAPIQNGVPNIIGPAPSAIPNIVMGPPVTEPTTQAPVEAPIPTPVQVPTPVETQSINQGVNVTPQASSVAPMAEPMNQPQMAPSVNQPQQTPQVQPQQPQVEKPVKEKKKDSPVVVALLIIVLIAVIAYIVIYLTKPFDKNKNNDTPTENTPVENQPESTTTEPAWITYLQGQNITNITIERTTEDASDDKTVNLTDDQFNNLYNKLTSYSLVKRYLEGSGFTYGDIITIAYAVGENNYEVKIANGMLVADTESLKDEDLRNALESSEHITENEDIKDNDGVFYNYIFQNYDSSILDEYFNQNTEETTEEVSD